MAPLYWGEGFTIPTSPSLVNTIVNWLGRINCLLFSQEMIFYYFGAQRWSQLRCKYKVSVGRKLLKLPQIESQPEVVIVLLVVRWPAMIKCWGVGSDYNQKYYCEKSPISYHHFLSFQFLSRLIDNELFSSSRDSVFSLFLHWQTNWNLLGFDIGDRGLSTVWFLLKDHSQPKIRNSKRKSWGWLTGWSGLRRIWIYLSQHVFRNIW